jgi:hypothetical protein
MFIKVISVVTNRHNQNEAYRSTVSYVLLCQFLNDPDDPSGSAT